MGRIDLGLSEPEFWALTPRLYRALLDRRRELRNQDQERSDWRAGVIAAAMGNAMGGKKDGSAFQPKDYFRFEAQERRPSVPRDANTPLPAEEQAAIESGWIAWATAAKAAAARKRGLQTT